MGPWNTRVRGDAAKAMNIIAVGLTDVGLQREHNEDCFRILDEYGLYLVADGMGGHQAGDVASRMAVDAMEAFFAATEKEDATWPFPFDPNLSTEENRLAASVKVANRQIYTASCNDRTVQGMGTTVVGMVYSKQRDVAYFAHVGDSRAYRLRDGELKSLTRDHSLVNDYLMMMPDLPEEAMDVLPKNVITRALGMQDSVVVDLTRDQAQAGDLYLLCSDGLCGHVPDSAIVEVLEETASDLDACAQALVQLANEAGGEDNVTVVLARVSE